MNLVSDKMFIRDLKLRCIIGTKPAERTRKQNVIINIELECDLAAAGRSDRLEDTVNYSYLCRKVTDRVRKSRYRLIERLAQQVAGTCLAGEGVRGVKVTVDKPGALRRARSAGVEIHRRKGGSK